MKCTLIHYDEIAIKKDRREFFENKLIDNIKAKLQCKVKRLHGRMVIYSEDSEKLKEVAGISHFSIAEEVELEKIAEAIMKLDNKEDYRIKIRGSSKVNHEELRQELMKKLKGSFNIEAKQTYFVEIAEKAYVYKEKIKGMGGLPVGSTGKVVSLISGGIDSPVAAYRMFKRGCEVVFIHFYNDDLKVKSKINSLIKELSKYQNKTKAYLIPFLGIQKDIIANVKDEHRMVIYRRAMMRIAEKILEKEKALAIVTGDNLAQVASQTLENLNVIYKAANHAVIAPLIGENKVDIIKEAKQIGTFEISSQPYNDCCSFMVAKHPALKADLNEIGKMERKLDRRLEEKAVKGSIANSF